MLDRRDLIVGTSAVLAAARLGSETEPAGARPAARVRLVARRGARGLEYGGAGAVVESRCSERLRVELENRLDEPTALAFAGLGLSCGALLRVGAGEVGACELVLARAGSAPFGPALGSAHQAEEGLGGLLVVHGAAADGPPPQRDLALLVRGAGGGAADVEPAAPLEVRRGERLRLRVANLALAPRALRLLGQVCEVAATEAGRIRPSARWPASVVELPPLSARELEWTPQLEGEWPLELLGAPGGARFALLRVLPAAG